jgi:RNA polymerase sigma-70 factor (sigma-E family)
MPAPACNRPGARGRLQDVTGNNGDAGYVEYVSGRMTTLRRVAYLLCRDWHSADDLVQVAVTRLFAHWSRARRMDNLDAYVRKILFHAFISQQRSAWDRRIVLADTPPEGPVAGVDRESVLDVRDALQAVPPRQRATLVLRYYCDLDVEQAALALGCSPGTVKSQTAKGLAALKRVLEPAMEPTMPTAGGANRG